MIAAVRLLAPLAAVILIASGVRADDPPKPNGSIGIRVAKDETKGINIQEVIAGSPAEKAGLKTGDVVLKLDGKEVGDLTDFIKDVTSHKPDDKITLTIQREGK